MRLKAPLDEGHHAHLLAYIYFKQFSEPKPVDFLIDTGCTVTTIMSDYATLLGINCALLRQSPNQARTANGNVKPYIMDNVLAIFEADFGFLNLRHGFKGVILKEMACHTPTPANKMTKRRITNAISLLGMDFLYQFKKWRYTDKFLIIEE